MRQQSYSDKQREAQQRKKQEELWAKTHPKPEAEKAQEPAEKTAKTEKPARRTA